MNAESTLEKAEISEDCGRANWVKNSLDPLEHSLRSWPLKIILERINEKNFLGFTLQ